MEVRKNFPTRQAALDHIEEMGANVKSMLREAAEAWKATPDIVMRMHPIVGLVRPATRQRCMVSYIVRAENDQDILGKTVLTIDWTGQPKA
jgi:NurA-like 5'-3' nuclease